MDWLLDRVTRRSVRHPGPRIYMCDMLRYTTFGLFMVFFWLLWGDFTMSIMEDMMVSVVPLQLASLGASNKLMAVLLATIPSTMNFLVNPVFSFRSDRYRSKWGRRIPFLLAPTPIITVVLVAIVRFVAFAVAHNPNVRVTVQEYWLPNDTYEPVYPLETWKQVDHNAATIGELRNQHAVYFADMDGAVRSLNGQLGKYAVLIVPVGQAALALREEIIAGTAPGLSAQADLFTDSWGHPTLPLKVLAAYCHFATIYRRSPLDLPLPGVLAGSPNWDSGPCVP